MANLPLLNVALMRPFVLSSAQNVFISPGCDKRVRSCGNIFGAVLDPATRGTYRGICVFLRPSALLFLACLLTTVAAEAELPPEQSKSFIGVSAFPLASDETFGAGLNAGWTRDWYAFSVRESFMLSPTRYATAENLQRITRRVSFEMTAEAVLRAGHFVFYGGPGGAVRVDRLERIFVLGNGFRRSTATQTLVRPVLTLGVVDRLVDMSVNAFFEGKTVGFRFGLGVVTDR
ncbi:MAG: hypothetical protein SFV15_21625 [Polyangiaceae bacterium]|nr:hypothetical protein [Polyangiaceae bacterium]